MTTLFKLNWKLFVTDPASALPSEFFAMFNTWIPDSPEVFIDVADYSHVHDGPLTILVGHHVDYYLDDSGRRRGLLYSRKQPLDGTLEEILAATLKTAIAAALRVEGDSTLAGKVRFTTSELLFTANDRALAPNTDATFQQLKGPLEAIANRLYGKGKATVHPLNDPKQRFSVRITGNGAPTLQDLLSNL